MHPDWYLLDPEQQLEVLKVRGSDGSMFGPGVLGDAVIEAFDSGNPDLECLAWSVVCKKVNDPRSLS